MSTGPTPAVDHAIVAAANNVDRALKRQLLLYADRMIKLANQLRTPDDELDDALTRLQCTLAAAVR